MIRKYSVNQIAFFTNRVEKTFFNNINFFSSSSNNNNNNNIKLPLFQQLLSLTQRPTTINKSHPSFFILKRNYNKHYCTTATTKMASLTKLDAPIAKQKPHKVAFGKVSKS